MPDRARSRLSHGFPPVVSSRTRVLILGSLPGRMSLERQQYYGQPRNAFWTIMGEICGARPELDYPARLAALERAGIVLWDVLAAAERPGSLDSSIVRATIHVNDFAALFQRFRDLRGIFFNGRKAADLFLRHALPGLPADIAAVPRRVLPSTSPAFAGMPVQEKLEKWRSALAQHLLPGAIED